MTVVTTDLWSAEIPHQLEIDFESGVTSPPQVHPARMTGPRRRRENWRIRKAREAWELVDQQFAKQVAEEIASDPEASATAARAVVAPVHTPPRARRRAQRPRSTHRGVGYSSRNKNSGVEHDREQAGEARANFVRLRDRVAKQLSMSSDEINLGRFLAAVRELHTQAPSYEDTIDLESISQGGFHGVNVFGVA